MSKKSKVNPIKIYCDTCVLLDFFIKQRKNGISKFVLSKFNGKKYLGVISSFSLLELKDNYYSYSDLSIKVNKGKTPPEIIKGKYNRIMSKEERQKDNEEINEFFERNKRKIKLLVKDDSSVWQKSLEIMELENFSAPDAIHISSAILYKCQFFITKDEQLMKCLDKISEQEKLICIYYNGNTNIEEFIERFNKLSEEYEEIKIDEEEKIVKTLFNDFAKIIGSKDFDPEIYEKKLRNIKK